MNYWGGEEIEIGMRTWQCGGSIEYIPCSHVGHVFRISDHWRGQAYKFDTNEVTRNRLRAAVVWMDDYAKVAQVAANYLPAGMSIGSVEGRKQLRKRLQCHNFEWFL